MLRYLTYQTLEGLFKHYELPFYTLDQFSSLHLADVKMNDAEWIGRRQFYREDRNIVYGVQEGLFKIYYNYTDYFKAAPLYPDQIQREFYEEKNHDFNLVHEERHSPIFLFADREEDVVVVYNDLTQVRYTIDEKECSWKKSSAEELYAFKLLEHCSFNLRDLITIAHYGELFTYHLKEDSTYYGATLLKDLTFVRHEVGYPPREVKITYRKGVRLLNELSEKKGKLSVYDSSLRYKLKLIFSNL